MLQLRSNKNKKMYNITKMLEPQYTSIIVGIITFIILTVMKRCQNEEVNNMELMKISGIVSILNYVAMVYVEKPDMPRLTEPFTSASEA